MARDKSQQAEILEIIKQEHEEVKELFEKFESLSENGNTARSRASIPQELFDNLARHTELEEKLVYPSLKKAAPAMFYEAAEEHHVADLIIDELKSLDLKDPAYVAKMMVLRENIEHHIEEEEKEMFPVIQSLPEDALNEMAENWKAQKAEVKPQAQTSRRR